MKKLATAVAPKPIFSVIVLADLTYRCISPVSEQKILKVNFCVVQCVGKATSVFDAHQNSLMKIIVAGAKYNRCHSFPFHRHIVISIDI